VQDLDAQEMWRNLLIGRVLNREDRISEVIPLTEDWLQQANWTESTPLFNSAAYQLHPHLCRMLGVKRNRDILGQLDSKASSTYDGVISSTSIKEAAEKANQIVGGRAVFMLSQAVIDFACLRPDVLDPSSETYVGYGALAMYTELGMTFDEIREAFADKWPEHLETRPNGLHDFDIEGICCEFRKFITRQSTGIPSNRKYICKTVLQNRLC
jgi:hypothetical protein